MQLEGLSYQSAPLATGHPLSLPGAPDTTRSVTKVQPILDARRPETQLGNATSPSGFWRAAQNKPDPTTHNPPPSIMQIKISQMLQDQIVGEANPPEKEDSTQSLVDSKVLADAIPATGVALAENRGTNAFANNSDQTKSAEDAMASTNAADGVTAAGPSPVAGPTATPFNRPPKTNQNQTNPLAATRAAPTPERAPMNMPVRAAPAPQTQPSPTMSQAPAAYQEAASISRNDILSTLPLLFFGSDSTIR
ncbi:hypothetical protein J4E08_14315 [Sagittula sp. NFXS13]|uniref:hypothetical protein n=1 Tax=Sagittula sp. NFXS13 TaxID=2819095 RepID=UPI0032E012B6